MSFSIQGTGPGFFLTAPNQEGDVLRQNTVLEPPSNEFSTSNVAPDDQVFRDPDTSDNRSDQRPGSSLLGSRSSNRGQNSVFAPIPTEVRLGESLDRFQRFEEAPPPGGSTLTVSGNNVTVTNAEGESVAFDAEDNGRLIQAEDDRLLLRNDSEETSIELESDVDVTTQGDGELTVFGEDETVSVQAGNAFETVENRNELSVRNPNTASTLELGDENRLAVTGTRPGETDTLSVSGPGGAFLEFSQGETGSFDRNDDGTLTLRNETSGESITLEPGDDISVGGEAEATLENEATSGTLTLESGRDFSLVETEDGTVSIRDETSAESTTVAPEEEPPESSRPLRLRFFENLETRGLQQLNERLLAPPEDDGGEIGAENRRSEEEAGPLEEDDENEPILGSDDREASSLATESPFERSDDSKFGQLGEENDFGSTGGDDLSSFESSEDRRSFFDQASLRETFDVFSQSEEPTFSTTV